MVYAVKATDFGFGNAGNTMAQNRNALQSALATGRNVLLPKGVITLHGPLTFSAHGQRIIGEGPDQTVLIVHNSSGHSGGDFLISNGLSNVGFQDFTIRAHATSPPVAGWVFSCDGATQHGGTMGQAAGGDIRNVILEGMFNGFFFRDVNAAIVEDVRMQSMRGWAGVYVQALTPLHRVDQVRFKSVIVNFNPAIVSGSNGYGIVIDGNVHTVLISNTALINTWVGLIVLNSANLPFEHWPSFLTAYDLQIDYSRQHNVLVECGHRFRFTDCYFHSTDHSNGLQFGTNTNDITINTSVVSSSWANGIYFDGKSLGLHGVTIDRASRGRHNYHQGVLLGPNAQDVRVVGGGSHVNGAVYTQYGIARMNSSTWVELAAAGQHRGITGWKNW